MTPLALRPWSIRWMMHVMSHVYVSRHTYTSHGTYMNVSRHIYEYVTSHILHCCMTHLALRLWPIRSVHVMSHTYMSHHTYTSHVTYMNVSHRMYDMTPLAQRPWPISTVYESCATWRIHIQIFVTSLIYVT